MTSSEERGRWRRVGRLAALLPRLAESIGCRRKDHETRARVDSVPEGTSPEVLERRRLLARRRLNIQIQTQAAREEARRIAEEANQ